MAIETFPELAINLVYTVLCLVPGFVTVQTIQYVSGSDLGLDEFETSTWSLIASGLTLSVLYLLFAVWVSLTTGRFALVVQIDLQWVELVAAYPLILAVAVLIGYVLGRVIVRVRGSDAPAPTNGSERAAE